MSPMESRITPLTWYGRILTMPSEGFDPLTFKQMRQGEATIMIYFTQRVHRDSNPLMASTRLLDSELVWEETCILTRLKFRLTTPKA